MSFWHCFFAAFGPADGDPDPASFRATVLAWIVVTGCLVAAIAPRLLP